MIKYQLQGLKLMQSIKHRLLTPRIILHETNTTTYSHIRKSFMATKWLIKQGHESVTFFPYMFKK